MNTLTDRAIYGSTYVALAALDTARAFGRALSVAVVYAAFVVVSWLVLAGAAVMVWQYPAVSAFGAACAFAGWWAGHRRRAQLAEVADWHDEEITADKLAKQRNDVNFVRISGETPAVNEVVS